MTDGLSPRLIELSELVLKRQSLRLLQDYLLSLPDNPNKALWMRSIQRAYVSIERRIEYTTCALYTAGV